MKKVKVVSAVLIALSCVLFIASCNWFFKISLPAPTKVAVNAETKTLTWLPVLNATGYVVSIDGEEQSAVKETSFSLAGLTEIKIYTLKVKALGNGKKFADSGWSAAAEYTVSEQLSAPQNLRADGTNLLWDAVANASAYAIYIDEVLAAAEIEGTSYSLSAWTDSNEHQIKVKALGNGTTYLDSEWSTYTYGERRDELTPEPY